MLASDPAMERKQRQATGKQESETRTERRPTSAFVQDGDLAVRVNSLFIASRDKDGEPLAITEKQLRAAKTAAWACDQVKSSVAGSVFVFYTQQGQVANALRVALAMASPKVYETRRTISPDEGEAYTATRTAFVCANPSAEPVDDATAIRAIGIAIATELWSS